MELQCSVGRHHGELWLCTSTVLHWCTALHCTALWHCTTLHCTALHCTVLHCRVCTMVLHCSVGQWRVIIRHFPVGLGRSVGGAGAVRHCTALLHCTALHCSAMHCTALRYCSVNCSAKWLIAVVCVSCSRERNAHHALQLDWQL